MAEKTAGTTTSKIGFPVKCDYKGGISALGERGKHLWIEDGNIGHGEFKLTHKVSLSGVAGVDIIERTTGGADAQPMLAQGVHGAHRSPRVKPKQFTEVSVRMKDGQVGLWAVQRHEGDWVRNKLAPALHAPGLPSSRSGAPEHRLCGAYSRGVAAYGLDSSTSWANARANVAAAVALAA
jgi:hypothetical protein